MTQEVFDWSSADAFFRMLLGNDYALGRVIENGESVSHECFLPPSIGTGRMEFVDVRADLKIVILDCKWHVKRTVRIRDGGRIRFNFNKRSEVDVESAGPRAEKLSLSSWNIIRIPNDLCTLERVKEGAKTSLVTAICSPEYISRISGMPEKDLPKPLQKLYDENTCESIVSTFDLSPQISIGTQQVIHTDLDSGLRTTFIAAKAKELICLSLDNLLSQKPEYLSSYIRLNKADNDKIRKAKARLDKSFPNHPSVEKLAAAIGINRNKLFYGFKFLTGRTISQYQQEMKLKQGYELLLNTNMDIGEIADQVGFRHQCNFSTAFKRFFGATPTSLRSGKEKTASHHSRT